MTWSPGKMEGMVEALLLMDASSKQGWGLGDVCVDGTPLAQYVLVSAFLMSLPAPAREQRLVPCLDCPCAR